MTPPRMLTYLALFAAVLSAHGAAIRIGTQEIPAARIVALPVADSGGRVSVDADAVLAVTLPGAPTSELQSAQATLTGPQGKVKLERAVGSDRQALYLQPEMALKPGTPYTLELRHGPKNVTSTLHLLVNGRVDGGGPSGVLTRDGGRWVPELSKQRDDWSTHLPDHSLNEAALLRGAGGVTALSGQVRTIADQPLANVTLKIGDVRTRTDAQGRFLLSGLPKGGQVLTIDASSANRLETQYGLYQAHVDLKAGHTTTLPYTVWMSRLATEHKIRVASPTTQDTVVRSPEIPGLELRIPKGTVIRDLNGKMITEITITPIPIDRSPFPLPRFNIPTYFTVQPGGARLLSADGKSPRGAQLVYPNYSKLKPGDQGQFWNYDPGSRGWYAYGRGHVSTDGQQVVPDTGVSIYEFTGAMFLNNTPPPKGPPLVGPNPPDPPAGDPADGSPEQNPQPPGPPCTGGNPINCASGAVIRDNTDIVISDVIPISISRTFIQDDDTPRAFGKGWSLGYDSFLNGKNFQCCSYYKEVDVILPNGGRVHFIRSVPGDGYSDSVFKHVGSQSEYYGATLSYNAGPWLLKMKDGTKITIPETSAISDITDRNGNKVTITRDGFYATRITSPSGRTIDLTLDSSNRISKVTDYTGRSVTYTYDADGYLSTVTFPDGTTQQYTYVSFADYPYKMLSLVKNRRGVTHSTTEFAKYISQFTTQFQYSGGTVPGSAGGGTLSRAVSTSAPVASSTSAPANFISYSNSPTGTAAIYSCEAYKPSKQTFPDGGILTFQWTLDNYCRVISVLMTDARGNKRLREFSIDGYLTRETEAVGTSLQRVVKTIERTASFPRWSARGGLPPTTTLPSAPGTDPGSNFIKQSTDVAGRVVSFQYDAAGNPTQITSPAGTSTATYNAFGFPLTATNVLGQTVTFTYDNNGNLTSVKDSLGKTTVMTYTALGQLATVTDPLNRVVTYAYSGPDLVGVSDPLGRSVSFGRDSLGRLTSTSDPLGRITSMQYDVMGRVVQTTDPAGKTSVVQYDGEDNVLQLTDPANKVFKWAYDWDNRVTSQTDPLGQAESYSYDLNGNPKTFTDRKGQVSTSTYDALDRMTGITDPVGSIVYGYDNLDRVTSLTEGSRTLSYAYNTLDQLTSETSPEGTVGYAYDSLGKRTGLTVSGGTGISYGYDAGNRLTGMTRGAQTVAFGYDAADRTTGVTLPNGVVQGYSYDAGDQLSEIKYQKGATLLGTLTYSYDSAGQRTGMGGSYARTILPTAVTSGVYDANNRLTTWGSKTLTYDVNGNLTGDGTYSYVWNARNQLTQVKQGATLLGQYAYDSMGRRYSRTLGTTATKYLYDGDSAIRESVGPANTELFGAGTDKYFSRTDASGTQSYLTDALGSVLALGNAGGTLDTSYTYGPYGQTSASGAATANSTQYTSREKDVGDLYFYRARYYSSEYGRFIGQDPIGLIGGANWYSYANGNPIQYIDPLGLDAIVTVNGNNVIIQIPITYSGPGSTPAVIAAWNSAISSTWTGQFGRYNVVTTVTQGNANNININSGAGRANVTNQNRGQWYNSGNSAWENWTASHEAGHLMGLGDRYRDAVGPMRNYGYPIISVPQTGWAGNIMGQGYGIPDQRNIDSIIVSHRAPPVPNPRTRRGPCY